MINHSSRSVLTIAWRVRWFSADPSELQVTPQVNSLNKDALFLGFMPMNGKTLGIGCNCSVFSCWFSGDDPAHFVLARIRLSSVGVTAWLLRLQKNHNTKAQRSYQVRSSRCCPSIVPLMVWNAKNVIANWLAVTGQIPLRFGLPEFSTRKTER